MKINLRFKKVPDKRKKYNAISSKIKWRFIRFSAMLLIMCAALYTLIAVMIDNDTFEITFYRVTSSKLKNNMRTVVIADIHMMEFGPDNSVLTDAITRLNPDFISVVGDVNTYQYDGLDYTKKLCSQLVAIAPTYYALGNNEIDEIVHNKIDYRVAIPETGVTLLHNRTIERTINDNNVVLGGLSYRIKDTQKYAPDFLNDFLSKDGYRILLTHFPESFLSGLQYEDMDLAICGHAHGGQVRLPFIGALYAPDQGLLPKLTEGCINMGRLQLVISRGLGNGDKRIPRVNNKPELVVVDMCTY